MNKISFLFILLLLVHFTACKKDKDEQPPIIVINSPTENSSYNVLDQVPLNISFSDNQAVKSVMVSLISADNGKKVLNTLNYSPNQAEFLLNTGFPLSDSLLVGGSYYFKVEAQDGDNTAAAFKYIQVNGLPKKMIGLISICSDGTGSQVYQDQADFNFNQVVSFNAAYFTSTINNYDQQLWFLPDDQSNIQVFQLNENEIQLNKKVNSQFSQAFTDITQNHRMQFIATMEGEVWAFNYQYAERLLFQSPAGRSIYKIVANDKYLLADESELNGGNRFINVIYNSSGAVKTAVSITYPTVEMFFKEEDMALLFQNDQQGGRISELIIESSAKRKVTSIPDSIVGVTQINADEYLISTHSKVWKYQFSSDNLLAYLNISHAIISYDSLNNRIYVASGSRLELYQYQNASLLSTTFLPAEIEGLEVRYNR